MNTLFDAFISYGRADSKAFATKLHAHLLEQGLNIWFDQNDIPLGVDFQNQIDDGIEKSKNFLFIIAPHSVNSPYCLKEIKLAIHRNKRIIPLLHVEQISRETWQERNPQGTDAEWEAYQAAGKHSSFPNMHPEIGKINWVYFREEIDDFQQSFAGLLELLDRRHDYVQQHTQLLVQALDWDRHQRQTPYLLVEEQRTQAENWLKQRFKDEQSPCEPTRLHCEFICESTKNAHNLLTQVFLSYSEQDKDLMERLQGTLMRQSFTTWTNKTDIRTGEDFQAAIDRGIEEADNLVYLLSPDSIRSQYCQQELAHALSLNKRIVPLLIRETDTSQIPDNIKFLHFIDFTDNAAEIDFQKDVDQLIKVLNQDAAYYEQHKQLLTKALRWMRQDRNPSLLLRGGNLEQAQTWLKTVHIQPEHKPLALHREYIEASASQPAQVADDVFISYSPANADFARRLNDALTLQGKFTWFDQNQITTDADPQQDIRAGIESANTFLLIVSPDSVSSPECIAELDHATKFGKRILPVFYRQVPAANLPEPLVHLQGLDFSGSQDINATITELIRVLDSDRAHLQTHTQLLVKALEWEDRQRNDGSLLRGLNLTTAEEWLATALAEQKDPPPAEQHKIYIGKSREVEDANRRLAEAGRKAARQVRIGSIVLSGMLVAAAVVGGLTIQSFNQLKRNREVTRLESAGVQAQRQLEQDELEALMVATRAGRALQQLAPEGKYPTQTPITALRQILSQIREKNQLQGHEEKINGVKFSPDGQLIATASNDETVRLWDRTGKQLVKLIGHNRHVNDVAFSPDGERIAAVSDDLTIRLWDLEGNFKAVFQGHTNEIKRVAFSPDGEVLVTTSDDGTARVWNLEGKQLLKFEAHEDEVRGVRFSPDGEWIATASIDGTAKVWDRQGNVILDIPVGDRTKVLGIDFSPDGEILATASDDGIARLWDLQGNLKASLRGHLNEASDVRFSPDGETVATVSSDNTARIWDLDGNQLFVLRGHRQELQRADFSPDGRFLITSSEDATARLWDLESNQRGKFAGHNREIDSVVFSRGGTLMLTASEDNTAKLWNVQGDLITTFAGHASGIDEAAFSPNGQLVATASDDRTARLWDLKGKTLATLDHPGEVESIDFSPDGKTVVTASDDKKVRLWDLEGNLLQDFRVIGEHPATIRFSPDEQSIFAGAGDGTIKQWDLTGKPLQAFVGHQGGINSLRFSPDGQSFITASNDETVRVWTLDGEQILEITEGHKGGAVSAEFNSDGSQIATGNSAGDAQIWERTGDKLNKFATFEGQQGVARVEFSPNDQFLAVGSADGVTRLWRIEPLEELLEDGCTWLENYLTTNPGLEAGDRNLCPAISEASPPSTAS